MEKEKPIIGILTDTKPLNLLIENSINKAIYDSVILSSDSSDIYKEIEEGNFSCLFLKTSLKFVNGLELCNKIREKHELNKMRIIFLSTDDDIAEKSIQYRANHFIRIPFKSETVSKAIKDFVVLKKVALYVDDSDIYHKSLVPQLENEGFEVIQAYDGVEASEILKSNFVDIIISDVEMPNMDGYSLCRNVKSNNITKNIPVILTTTLTSDESIEKGFASGANDYLTKPFVIPELIGRIKHHLYGKEHVRPEKILVVDDDPISRSITVQALKTNGFAPYEARNGRVALSLIRNNDYHLVITNYDMPILNGFDLVLKLRENPKTSDLKVIMTNSRQTRSNLVKIQSIGIETFIVKPFIVEKLLSEVERILAQGRLDRERKALKYYLTDDAINSVLRAVDGNVEEIHAQDCFRTIMFTDIEKFTPLCENLTSHEVVSTLDTYFDKMVAILFQFDANIDKFIGDAIMALFGRQEDGAHRAVCAGLALINGLDSVREKTGIDLHMRVGINSGHVIMGDIGSRLYRRDYTVIGDNVNIAQRLESNAGRDGVLISESTYNLIKDKIIKAEPKEVSLKGKLTPQKCYLVSDIQPYHRE